MGCQEPISATAIRQLRDPNDRDEDFDEDVSR